MERHELALTMCAWCGHVQNNGFDPGAIPAGVGLRMFNEGTEWSRFLVQQFERLVSRLPAGSVVVEVGHGGGEFLSRFAASSGSHRCVGIDPSGQPVEGALCIRRNFESSDVAVHRPHLVLLRHVLEHLNDPRGFVEGLCAEALNLDHKPLVYAEVPSNSEALATGRFSDFLYEHASHFSAESLEALWRPFAAEIVERGSALGGEVLWVLVELNRSPKPREYSDLAQRFATSSRGAVATVRGDLEGWVDEGQRVAVWGGTGKAAAFLNRVGDGLDLTVVDSDSRKVGGWVPGLGLPIQSPAVLQNGTVPVVVIPSVWRIPDVLAELARMRIETRGVFAERGGALIRVDQSP